MSATALLESTATSSEVITPDWEAPAGGAVDLPRIAEVSFTYRGRDDEHLFGQTCLALEPSGPAPAMRLVGFACGCRRRVPSRLLVPR